VSNSPLLTIVEAPVFVRAAARLGHATEKDKLIDLTEAEKNQMRQVIRELVMGVRRS
jgi:hypothetical protein